MAKITLNQTKRTLLIRFMEERVVADPELEKAHREARERREAAAERLKAVLFKAMEKRYPRKDMDALEKYHLTRSPSNIGLNTDKGGVQWLGLPAEILEAMRVAYEPNSYRREVILDIDKAGEKVFWHYKDAEDGEKLAQSAVAAELTERRADYRSLIDGVKTFEEVLAVWPECAPLTEQIGQPGTSLLLLSDEVKERIAEDSAKRMEAAA